MYEKWVLVTFFLFLLTKIEGQYTENRRTRVRHQVHSNNSVAARHSCDQLEQKLTKLEQQSVQNSQLLNYEQQETNRRLQALEWQSADVRTVVGDLRNHLERFTQRTPEREKASISTDLDLKIDNVAKGLQLVVAALRQIKQDVNFIKSNISDINLNARNLPESDQFFAPSDPHIDIKRHNLEPFTAPNSQRFPANCKEVQKMGINISGIYRIQAELSPRPFMVLCDMETSEGGWTYIQNRHEGGQEFYLDWQRYKIGFGNLGGEFWLGLDYLHQLTGAEVNELLIEMVDLDEKRVYAHYEAFSVGNEEEGFALKVLGGYSGNAGDSLTYHAGSKFSTKDMDQDEWPEGSCARAHRGAWWYKSCDQSNLNGQYLKGQVPDSFIYRGMYWGGFHGPKYSLLRSRMMVRPRYTN